MTVSGLLISMEEALVLLTVEPMMERQIIDRLRQFPAVRETHFIYGPYDIYIKVEADSTEDIRRMVLDEIRNIPGIRSTMTCFLAE